jgi:outer membrane protein TolC
MRRALLFVLLAASPVHADLMKKVLDAGDGGGGAPASPLDNDLWTWAGEPKPVSIGDLLQVSIRQAPALASARLDIEIANAQIMETTARNDWQLKAQLLGSKSIGFIGGFANDATTYGGTGDAIRLLPTGGTLDLHVGSQWQKSDFDLNGTVATSTEWQQVATVGIIQPLLKGLGSYYFDANERKARISRDYMTLARRLAAINTVQAVVSAYWDLVLAERTVAISQQSLDLARERLRITQIGADGGKIARSEIPAVQQTIATREEDLLTNELGVLNQSFAVRRAVGMPIGPGELGLRVPSDLDPHEQPLDLAKLTERALAQSPELAQLAKQADSATIDIEVTENGLLPQLDAALSLGPTGQDPNFNTSMKNLVELKQITINGSLTFSRSIGQHDVVGKSRELRAGREKLKVTAFDVRQQYAQGMARAVAAIELAKRRVQLSQRAIELANENIRIETDRFNLGRSTNFDVLLRQDELRQAELRKVQATIDWHKAEVVIQALTGDILPAYGITVE